MQYRRLGQSALKLSALSYGSWITFGTTLDDRAARDCRLAPDHGINFFDSAEVYLGGEAERMLGRAIKALAGRATAIACRARRCTAPPTIMRRGGGPRRTQQGLSRKHLVEACEQALRRFGLDYLDLYRAIDRTRTCRSRKSPGPCTRWCNRARSCTGALRNGRRPTSRRCAPCRAPRPGAAAAGAAAVQPVPSRARRARVPSAGRAARAGADDLVAAGLGRAGRPV